MSSDDLSRFSVSSNLMNYSIPKSDSDSLFYNTLNKKSSYIAPFETSKREIQPGDADTRIRQLEAQIEELTLQNVKFQRINRLLKIDTDNLIKQKTTPLHKTIEELTITNIKLQRTSRLLQSQLQEQSEQMNKMQQNQILQMKNVGPEYEFLVQNINLLQRQIAGHPTCDETCCFTMKPIDQSNMIMTLPSADSYSDEEDQEIEAQHICRPIIHSTISQGSYAVELENKIHRLERLIEELDQEKDQIYNMHQFRENDIETLKKELRIKDDIVSQLEQDFMRLEEQIEHLQKELINFEMNSNCNNSNSRNLFTPPPTIQNELKRQSQLIMEAKRKSLAVKDMDLLAQMLKEAGIEEGREESDGEDHSTESTIDKESMRSSSPSTFMIVEDNEEENNNNKGTTTTQLRSFRVLP